MKWTDTQRIAEELYDLHGETIDPENRALYPTARPDYGIARI